MYQTLYSEPPDELPSVNYVQECRVLVEIIGETIAAMKLALAGHQVNFGLMVQLI
jgi:hypothetical protein